MAAILVLEAYYNLKHLIFPDVEFGIAKCIRGYTLLSLLLCLCTALAYTGLACDRSVLILFGQAGRAVCILAILPVLKQGVEQWIV